MNRTHGGPHLIATTCLLAGGVDIVAAVVPRLQRSRSDGLVEVGGGAWAAAGALGCGLLLVLLAHVLRRCELRAWWAAMVLLPLGACAQLAYRHSPAGLVGVAVSLVPLWLLVRDRTLFDAPPDPRGRWRALANFVLLGAGSLLIGLAVVSAHPRRLIGAPSLVDRLEHVLCGLLGLDGPLVYAGGAAGPGRTVTLSLAALGLVTAVSTLYLAFRPEGRPAPAKGVVFSPSGKAAVRYRVVSGVMLAKGDPEGDVEAWPGAMERFMDEARTHSWTPAVVDCSETGCAVWTRETGLTARPRQDSGAARAGRGRREVPPAPKGLGLRS